MRWVGLTYSLPSAAASSKRVAVWRRLRQLGAVSPTGSLYLLPAGDESQEAFDWLAQEIAEGEGEALVLQIDRLEGDAEARVVELSRAGRDEEYRKIAADAEEAAKEGKAGLADRLERLRRRFDETVRIDLFHAPERATAAAALSRLQALLHPGNSAPRAVATVDPAKYRGRRWVTRPRPYVDRLACAWLIRRFVDPQAEIRYSETAEEGEVAFDMRGADFGHRGSLCSFETLIAAFGLGDDPALAAVAEIVHEIDLRDGSSARPEVAGIDSVLRGWSAAGWSDGEIERHGMALFEGLYGGVGRTEKTSSKNRSRR